MVLDEGASVDGSGLYDGAVEDGAQVKRGTLVGGLLEVVVERCVEEGELGGQGIQVGGRSVKRILPVLPYREPISIASVM